MHAWLWYETVFLGTFFVCFWISDNVFFCKILSICCLLNRLCLHFTHVSDGRFKLVSLCQHCIYLHQLFFMTSSERELVSVYVGLSRMLDTFMQLLAKTMSCFGWVKEVLSVSVWKKQSAVLMFASMCNTLPCLYQAVQT